MTQWRLISCGQCDEQWQITEELYLFLKRSSNNWFCPHGHQRHFPQGESQETKLRRERDQLKQRIAYKDDMIREAEERATRERNRANGYKGHATKITKRAKAGVCPCCNRTFQQLARHMASQHPTFTPMELEDRPPDGATVQ